MPVQTVKNVPLAQIPDLDRRVRAGGEKVATVRVECDLVNGVCCRIIVLNRLLAPDVKDLDDFV